MSVTDLIDGYRAFYKKCLLSSDISFRDLSSGQFPKVLLIGCCDSRVDPVMITNSKPGDILVVRNVAGLVPNYQPDTTKYHGVSAAIEFATNCLNVEDIIVMGHSQCGGIRALVDGVSHSEGFSFIDSWMGIANDAKNRLADAPVIKDKYVFCEKEAIKVSLANLLTFPFIKSGVDNGDLTLHGWYFQIETGRLFALDEASNLFTEI